MAVLAKVRSCKSWVPRSIAVECVFVIAVLCLRPILVTGEAMKGSMELVCVPPTVLDIRLEGAAKLGTLTLHLWATPANLLKTNKPLSVTATWCTSADVCEQGKGIVQLRSFNLNKKASGTYKVEFSLDHIEEGSFSVARRQQENPFLCQ